MEWKTAVKHLSSHLFWLMLETLPACIILHLRSRKDFAGKTKHRRTSLKQKTINLPLLIWIYVIYWFLNCLSPEEKKKTKETIYIVSFSNRSKLKPFNTGNGRVVSSSCTSLTHSQVNLLVIKSTPMYLLPRESGLITKMNTSGFSLFTADQVLLLLTLMSWPIYKEFWVKVEISNLRPRELEDLAGGSGVGCIWEDSQLVTSTRTITWKNCSNVAAYQKATTCT